MKNLLLKDPRGCLPCITMLLALTRAVANETVSIYWGTDGSGLSDDSCARRRISSKTSRGQLITFSI